MKLSEIKATKDNPAYVNLRSDGINGGGFPEKLKWDGKNLFILNTLNLWIVPRPEYHINENDMNSNAWYIC